MITYIKSTNKLIKINVNGEEIKTTKTHLFMMKNGYWKAAENIKKGDMIVKSDGEIREVNSTDIVY